MATSPDKLFTLEPRETKAVAPVDNFTGLTRDTITRVDNRLANQSLNRGLTNLSTALLNLGAQRRDERIAEDVRIAQEAGAREEVMPGGLLPVAQRAYRDVIDINTKHATILETEKYLEGNEFTNIVKSDLQSRQKTDHLRNTLSVYRQKALATIQNPQVIIDLNKKFNELIQTNETIIYEFERDKRDLEIIQGMANVVDDAQNFAIKTEVDFTETFTGNWLSRMAKDTMRIAPDMTEDEAKILTFKVLTNDFEMLGRPSVIHALMKSEFSKGISYFTLYSKASVPNRRTGKIDEDAKQFGAVYDAYITNSKAYFQSIEDDNKIASDLFDERLNEALLEHYANGGDGRSGRIIAEAMGVHSIGDLNKIQTEGDKYSSGLKLGIKSEEGVELLREIVSNKITDPNAVKIAMMNRGIDLKEFDEFSPYIGLEASERTVALDALTKSIRTVDSQAVRLFKGSLKGNLLDENGQINREALADALFKVGLLPDEVFEAMTKLQVIRDHFDERAIDLAKNAAATNTPVDTLSYQQAYQEQISTAIAEIQAGFPGPTTATVPDTSVATDITATLHQRALHNRSFVKNKDIVNDLPKFTKEQIEDITKTLEDLSDLPPEEAKMLKELVEKNPQAAIQTVIQKGIEQEQAASMPATKYYKEATELLLDLFDFNLLDPEKDIEHKPFPIDIDVSELPNQDIDLSNIPLPPPSIPFAEGFDFLGDTDESRRITDSDTTGVPVGEAEAPDSELEPLTEITMLSELDSRTASGAKNILPGVKLEGTFPEVLEISNHLFNDAKLFADLSDIFEFETSTIVSGFRPDRSSPHGYGKALDIRLRNTDKINATNLSKLFHSSLKRAGYQILLTQDGKTSITVQGEKGPQTWSRFMKDGKDYMMEIEKGEEPHLHIQLGDDFEVTRDIAKRW